MQDLIKRFEEIMNQKVYSLKYLRNGLSNDNYLINEEFIMRVPKNFHQPFNSYVNEKKIEDKLKSFPLSIDVVYMDESGIKISRFIKNAKSFAESSKDKKHIRLAAKAIRTLHNLKIVSETDFSYFDRLEIYQEKSLTPPLENAQKIIDKAKQWSNDAPKILCHNDLVGGNILFDGNKTYLIDYEYSSNNDPMFDIASFLSENNLLEKKAITTFVDEYCMHDTSSFNYQKLYDYFAILDLLWFYWAEMMYHYTHDDIYRLISSYKLNRIKEY